MNNKYKINSPHTVFDEIEGEIILINLKNGNYYNIEKNGAIVWEIIEKGGDLERFINLVSKKFNIAQNQVQKDIDGFIINLTMEALISPAEDENPFGIGSDELKQMIDSKMESYTVPVLNKYSDMRDALMLDPIHEVDERGWPVMNDDLYYRDQTSEEIKDKD